MKKKVVVKLKFQDGESKQKAMKLVSSIKGVTSIDLNTKDDKITVVGDFVLPQVMAKLKKWFPDLDTIGPAKKEKEDDKKDGGTKGVDRKELYLAWLARAQEYNRLYTLVYPAHSFEERSSPGSHTRQKRAPYVLQVGAASGSSALPIKQKEAELSPTSVEKSVGSPQQTLQKGATSAPLKIRDGAGFASPTPRRTPRRRQKRAASVSLYLQEESVLASSNLRQAAGTAVSNFLWKIALYLIRTFLNKPMKEVVVKKVVVKLNFQPGESKQEAMTAASCIEKVTKIKLNTKDDQITVVGDLDPLLVMRMLQKWYARCVTVKEEEKDDKKDGSTKGVDKEGYQYLRDRATVISSECLKLLSRLDADDRLLTLIRTVKAILEYLLFMPYYDWKSFVILLLSLLLGWYFKVFNITKEEFHSTSGYRRLINALALGAAVMGLFVHQRIRHMLTSSSTESFSKGILFLLGEEYEFDKDKLIQLWMAGGLIKDEPMEVIGARYFKKLESEKYILCSDANSRCKANSEKVNSYLDKIKDKSDYLRLGRISQKGAASTDALHVSLVSDDINENILKTLKGFNRLRTLLFLGNCGSQLQQVQDLCLNYEFLEILDLSGTHIKELPIFARNVPHLRYLDLSWTFIELLPETTNNFQRLITLRLKGCSRLLRLPRKMKRLIQLRHLELNVISQLSAMPEGMGSLVNLRTLSGFIVGTQEGCRITELRNLNNLTGEFRIARLENVQNANEAKEASLRSKRHLKKLELRWSDFQIQEIKSEEDNVLENLCPHSDLEELRILCYSGTTLPSWIANEAFHKLVSIALIKCERVSMVPSLHKLPSLESLELFSLSSVTKMDYRGETGNVAFPKLKKLVIDEMSNLETWTEAEEDDCPCLAELTIKDCPKLLEAPSLLYLPTIEHLEISCCQQLTFAPHKELSTSLELLIVEDCPLIKERYSKQGDQDWHKITC